MLTKICIGCKLILPATKEYFYKGTCKDKLDSFCKICHKINAKNYRKTHKKQIQEYQKTYCQKHKEEIIKYQQTHKEQYKSYNKTYNKNHPDKIKNKTLIYNYGIDLELYKKMVINQEGKCKICNRIPTKALCVDHDHKTNKIRGLLCQTCNVAIGLMEENLIILKNAINYLK